MGSLADTLLQDSNFQPDSAEGQNSPIALHQRLADEIVSYYFGLRTPVKSEKHEPVYKQDNPLLSGLDRSEIGAIEKQQTTSLFEFGKWTGGICSAYKWGPACMPKEFSPAALLDWKRKTGEIYIAYGSKSHAETVKELKLKYVSTCIGSMILGWTASHAFDRLAFRDDQYLEGALIGDIAGIGLAIAVPGWRQKALMVFGTHVLGKAVDHCHQPIAPRRNF